MKLAARVDEEGEERIGTRNLTPVQVSENDFISTQFSEKDKAV